MTTCSRRNHKEGELCQKTVAGDWCNENCNCCLTPGAMRLCLAMVAKSNFAKKYGFAYKTPQHFRNCSIFVFPKFRERKDLYLEARLKEKIKDKWNIAEGQIFSEEGDYVVAGMYIFYTWDKLHWAVPNDFPETIAFIRSEIPDWVEERKK